MKQVIEMLIKIKNALAVRKSTVGVPYSNFKYNIVALLAKEGFVEDVKKKGRIKKRLVIGLKYQEKKPGIRGLKIISKPGRRVYFKSKELYVPKTGQGILIVSTPKGILTGRKARKMKLGGEVICEIW
ncbi:MAG: 30S ribosomal protein S8 [Patescibacteria group bacterium]